MSRNTAIRCSGLTKTYVIPVGRGLGPMVARMWPGRKDRWVQRVEALKGVSFEIAQGEVFGILGHNGAGKSTLLACIAGITNWDGGEIFVNGRVDGLLKLGVGFHPHFTSRENAMIGSIAMGVPVKQAKEAVEEIIAFAELEKFAEVPYYTYSDGMKARLQFAVAIQRTPEILLIDEALGVGDGYFVNKCNRRIEEICKSGSTVLVVSHSIHMIEGLCQRAMTLDRGEVVDIGPAIQVGTKYRKVFVDRQFRSSTEEHAKMAKATNLDTGTGAVVLEEVSVSNDAPTAPAGSYVWWNHPMTIRVKLLAKGPIESPKFFLQVFTARGGTLVAQFDNTHVSARTGELETTDLGVLEGSKTIEFRIPRCPFAGNQYYVSFGIRPAVLPNTMVEFSDFYVYRRVAVFFQVVSFPEHPERIARTVLVEPEVAVEVT